MTANTEKTLARNVVLFFFILNTLKSYGIKYTMKLAPIIAVTIKAVIIIPFLVVLRFPTGRSTTLSSISR
jgi:hypothetical protein